jgi:hypothetical protein
MSCSFATPIVFLLGLAAVPLLATPLPSTPVSTTAGALPADMDVWKSALYNAYSTYCPADQLQDWNCKWCAKLPNVTMVGVVDNELYGTRSYVALQGRTILVASKGTSNIQNWFEDAQFVWKDLSWDGVPKGVEVETGFLSSYESLRTQVLNYTNQALSRCPGCEVHVAGHSLGGAQAFLFAADVKLLHNPTTRATTFGCPRVGNSDWGPWFASSVVPHATEDQFEWCTTAIVFPWHPLQQLVTFTYHTKSGKLLKTAHTISTARIYPQLVYLWRTLNARPNMASPRAC